MCIRDSIYIYQVHRLFSYSSSLLMIILLLFNYSFPVHLHYLSRGLSISIIICFTINMYKVKRRKTCLDTKIYSHTFIDSILLHSFFSGKCMPVISDHSLSRLITDIAHLKFNTSNSPCCCCYYYSQNTWGSTVTVLSIT